MSNMWAPLLLAASVIYGAASNTAKQPRITGGIIAEKGQFSWLVRLEATNFADRRLLCGSSLITPEWLLTAAHCLDSQKPEWLWAVSGEHKPQVDEGTEQFLLVDYFVIHPGYTSNETSYLNDVALVHLSTPAVLGNYTTLAPMPQASQAIEGPCYEAGWGETSEGSGEATILNWTAVELLDNFLCEAVYGSDPDPNSLCAGEFFGGAGACKGDNGGGLLCLDAARKTRVLAGIMSWREGCALPGRPAVYMEVSDYLDWIYATINTTRH